MNSMTKIDSVASTMTSREIAELTEKQHSHVCRDIRTMIDQIYGKERKYAEMDIGSPEYNRPVFRFGSCGVPHHPPFQTGGHDSLYSLDAAVLCFRLHNEINDEK